MSIFRGSENFLWDVTKPLGQGATSMVYKGRNKVTWKRIQFIIQTSLLNYKTLSEL